MKYTTKEELDGVKFYHKSNTKLIYTLSVLKGESRLQLSWNDGANTSTAYTLENILEYIEKKDWIVTGNSINYEIY